MNLPPSEFTLNVIKLIQKIPEGKVSTYKHIAELAGKVHAARGVAWILNSCSRKYKLPWHRVINSKGQISFDRLTHNYRRQKKLLRLEGVQITEDGQVDLAKYKWAKKVKKIIKKSQPKIFSL